MDLFFSTEKKLAMASVVGWASVWVLALIGAFIWGQIQTLFWVWMLGLAFGAGLGLGLSLLAFADIENCK